MFQERFSEPGGGDQISALQSQVEEVRGVMTQNIERVLERGQRLEELMDKTNDLEANVSYCCSQINDLLSTSVN
jgi:Synaptobrevin